MIKNLKGYDIVYHCAATAHEGLSVFSPNFITKNIYQASISVITASIVNKVEKFVLPKTEGHKNYLSSLLKDDIVFCTGPAGTGKTYLAVANAVSFLKTRKIEKIILSRPAVEAGGKIGVLPGDMKDKVDPYLRPIYDALHDMMPVDKVERKIASGEIEIAPLAFMRGRTLDNAFVILDEGQNTTHSQMKMFLTRMGKNAKFLITADPGQIDLPSRITSGIKEALLILKETDGIEIVRLNDGDIIRNTLVKKIIDAYKNIENTN
mgnify:CR=1 FL=1